MTKTQTEKRKTPRSRAVGRTKERLVEVPVSPENATTSNENSTDTTAVPMNFCAFDRPRDRCRRTFKKSSMNPTDPNPTAARIRASPAGLNVIPAAIVGRVAR